MTVEGVEEGGCIRGMRGAARRAAAVLTGIAAPSTTVISLAAYEQAAKNRNTLR